MEVINDRINDPKSAKRFYRSRDKVIGGVCMGLSNYFNIDVVLVRIIALVLLFLGTSGFWVYLILWIVTPMEPRTLNTGR